MSLFKWIVLGVVILIIFLYILSYFTKKRGKIPFIGLSPLTSSLKSSKKYLSTLLGGYEDSDDDGDGDDEPVLKQKPKPKPVPKPEPSPIDPSTDPQPSDPTKDTITIPSRWDFTDIRGDKKRERITRRVLETLYSSPFPTVRPKWIVNPRTGRNLEIDCYNEGLGLCVEVSGAQHYIQSARFHKSREEFLSQVFRDKVKKEAVLERGLDFMVVPYTVPTDEIPSYVLDMLRKLGRVEEAK